MTPQQEAKFEKQADKHFKSQRELPNGRDFRWNMQRDPESEHNYRNNFDNVFPKAPGAGI
jgi:hypothetical protein